MTLEEQVKKVDLLTGIRCIPHYNEMLKQAGELEMQAKQLVEVYPISISDAIYELQHAFDDTYDCTNRFNVACEKIENRLTKGY